MLCPRLLKIVCFFSHLSTPFLPYTPLKLEKKSLTAHPNEHILKFDDNFSVTYRDILHDGV